MAAGAIKPAGGSNRITRLVPEVNTGITPPSAAWLFLRNTGGAGLGIDQDTDESAELPGDVVGTTDIDVIGEVGTGSYNFEFSKDPAFEAIMESLLQSEFSDIDAEKLYAGDKDKTLTVEDEYDQIKESGYTRGMQVGSLNLSVVAGQQIVTGSWTGRGSTSAVSTLQTVQGASDISFSGSVITVGPGLPALPTPDAGSFVQVLDSTSNQNDGYYKITGVSGSDVTVNGTFITEATSNAALHFSGQTQFAATSGTGAVRGTSERIRSGNDVSLELSDDDGTTWYSILRYGIRLSQLDLTITAQIEDQLDIQETNPFVATLLGKSVEVTGTYHLGNLQARRWLDARKELDLRLSLLDSQGTGYRFRFPRAKGSGFSPGEAAKGQSMAGEWSLRALLKGTTKRDMEIERV